MCALFKAFSATFFVHVLEIWHEPRILTGGLLPPPRPTILHLISPLTQSLTLILTLIPASHSLHNPWGGFGPPLPWTKRIRHKVPEFCFKKWTNFTFFFPFKFQNLNKTDNIHVFPCFFPKKSAEHAPEISTSRTKHQRFFFSSLGAQTRASPWDTIPYPIPPNPQTRTRACRM